MSDHFREVRNMISDTPRMHSALIDAPEAGFAKIWQVGCDIERELTASNERVRLLISERDTARVYADQKWKLRQEFHDLFGTDNISEAVALVRELKDRIRRLEENLMDAKNQYAVLVADVVLYEDRGERIKRLEESENRMLNWLTEDCPESVKKQLSNAWMKSKEAKP